MDLFVYISDFIVPSIIILIVTYGVLEKVKVYDEFVNGAKKGLTTVIKIMPTLVGLMVAVSILRASGFLEFLSEQIGKVTDYIGLPSQLVPLSIVRLFSASAATGLVLDIFKEYGTDSRIGLIASIIMCCTETVFYTMSVYFMAAKVKKTRYTLTGALLATAAGIVASVWLAGVV
ncbi:MAG: spore maturation protein [Tyzzerella sp.]|nr:spore maturation protein [Tyzzerella sp.]